MKEKILIGVLAAAVVVLTVLLLREKKTVVVVEKQREESVTTLSNDLAVTQTKLSDQEKVNTELASRIDQKNAEIANRQAESLKLSNELASATASLGKVKGDLELTQTEVARRNARIAELETQNSSLDKQAADLKSAITDLEGKITDTEKKLANSEGEKTFLITELKRLKTEKAELERQFNDLAILKEQVRKLKDELAVARRLDWIRRGIYGNNLKGAERLATAFQKKPASTNQDLNVEIRTDGSARITPLPKTPAPVATPPSPK